MCLLLKQGLGQVREYFLSTCCLTITNDFPLLDTHCALALTDIFVTLAKSVRNFLHFWDILPQNIRGFSRLGISTVVADLVLDSPSVVPTP